jgi:7,8-dihydropterin-6-yl-methyl-4-(beta-D-ribofuranosyl)aminobenzene 5'-phosphate synthase
MSTSLNQVERIEILTLQDNYIDIAAQDGNEIVHRVLPLKDGQLKNTVLAEHGFSAFVTVWRGDQSQSLLFDFGLSEFGAAFNADVLQADLKSVTAVALSHGHADHTGGMQQLAQRIQPQGIAMTVHPAAFRDSRHLKIGPDFNIEFPPYTQQMVADAGFELNETAAPSPMLDGNVLFLGEIPRKTDFENGMPNAYYEKDGKEVFDAIDDDTAIVMHLNGKGLVVLSGCAHSGIVNTVMQARAVTGIEKIHAIMGGFHLTGAHFGPFIEPTAAALKAFDPDYIIPTHCTGRKAINRIEAVMEDKFLLNMAGTKMTFA